MGFDATFLIAVISFIVFVLIMNKIFYAPILKIMQEREALVKNNFEIAKATEEEAKKQLNYKNEMLEKSRKEAKDLILEHSQNFQEERNIRLAQHKEELYSNIANERENLRNSAIEAKEVLKEKVVDIAKDISQIILGDVVDKNTINKSQIEEKHYD